MIVVEFEDDIESKESRLCYWEIFARDRARFKDRIKQIEPILSSVLDKSHRERVYASRQNCVESSSSPSLKTQEDSTTTTNLSKGTVPPPHKKTHRRKGRKPKRN